MSIFCEWAFFPWYKRNICFTMSSFLHCMFHSTVPPVFNNEHFVNYRWRDRDLQHRKKYLTAHWAIILLYFSVQFFVGHWTCRYASAWSIFWICIMVKETFPGNLYNKAERGADVFASEPCKHYPIYLRTLYYPPHPFSPKITPRKKARQITKIKIAYLLPTTFD